MSDVNNVAESIADAVLDLRFTSKNDIKNIVLTHLKHLSKPDNIQKLEEKIIKHKKHVILKNAENNFWKNKLRIAVGEDNMKPHYDQCERLQAEFLKK